MSEICKRDFLQPDKPTNRLGSQISFYYGQQKKPIWILGYNQSQNSMTAGLSLWLHGVPHEQSLSHSDC